MKKIYYKHIIVNKFNQDDAERAINDYVKDAGNINILSLNVIPEQYSSYIVDKHELPKFRYHISIVYTSNEE